MMNTQNSIAFVIIALIVGFLVGTNLKTTITDNKHNLEAKVTLDQSQQPGRFTIFMNPTIRADQYLLDTQTGQVWQKVVCENYVGEPFLWEPMDRPITTAEESSLMLLYKKKPTAK